jgi:hypothetical protein
MLPMPAEQRPKAIAELEQDIDELQYDAAKLGDLDQPAAMLLGVRVSEMQAARQRVA